MVYIVTGKTYGDCETPSNGVESDGTSAEPLSLNFESQGRRPLRPEKGQNRIVDYCFAAILLPVNICSLFGDLPGT